MEQRLAALREEARRYNWKVEKGKKYYKLLCPCPGKHRKTMHLTRAALHAIDAIGDAPPVGKQPGA